MAGVESFKSFGLKTNKDGLCGSFGLSASIFSSLSGVITALVTVNPFSGVAFCKASLIASHSVGKALALIFISLAAEKEMLRQGLWKSEHKVPLRAAVIFAGRAGFSALNVKGRMNVPL